MKAFTLYAVNHNGTVIDGITDQDLDSAISEIVGAEDGSVDPNFLAVMSQDARMGFSTKALAKALAVVGTTGVNLGGQVLTMFFQQIDEGGTRKTGANHVKLTSNRGMLIPLRVTAEHRGEASMDLAVVPTWDGVNAPISIGANQSLVGSLGTPQEFTLGPVTINGTTLDGVMGATIEFGIDLYQLSGGHSVHRQFCAIQRRQPRIVVRTSEVDILATLGLSGVAVSTATAKLVKLAAGGSARSTSNDHILFTVSGGLATVRTARAGGNAPAVAEISIGATKPGANAILMVSLAAANP